MEKDHEIRILQKSWEDEQDRLNREIQKMQRKVDDLPRAIESATRSIRSECDSRVHDERRKITKTEEKYQDDFEKLRDDMSGEIRRIQAQCDEKISEYETKLELAHGNRMTSMFQMREEVESEFTDRMEQLRDMYKGEIENQSAKLESEKEKARALEDTLRKEIAEKQSEIDELNNYYYKREEELETKINDLLLRLQEQTALAVKLQAELDEYEWYEEDEEEGGGQQEENKDPHPRPPSSRGRPHSRPPSTKPLDQHRLDRQNKMAVYIAFSVTSHNIPVLSDILPAMPSQKRPKQPQRPPPHITQTINR